MTVAPQAASPIAVNHNADRLLARLLLPLTARAGRRGANSRRRAGPGLSAVDMAAACLCLAEAVSDADVGEPMGSGPTASPDAVRQVRREG